ncbi:LAME_0H04236g1_1 [Lachancea meyersii CBS 8951]|uniref:DNA mismatch repair protein HSM3 n=1 Tax=Lachancea meyersii CBS 8951 TaxID=1266667 RepID=A0A1G4KDU6_9SACH|nr:LAME_0H04236g1_1 [Lachancea meyersii CBS 8951]
MDPETRKLSHQILLDRLNCSIAQRNIKKINELMSRAQVELGHINNLQVSEASDFLIEVKELISEEPHQELDYDLVIDVLEQVISRMPFDQIIEQFSLEDLSSSIESYVPKLVKLACKVIQRSEPKGLFAGSGLVDLLLSRLFNSETDVGSVTEIENVFRQLSSDKLIRRRILSHNSKHLIHVKAGFDPICLARLVELLQVMVPFLDCSELNEKLLIFSEEEIVKSINTDIFLFIAITNYYIGLLESTRSKLEYDRSSAWLVTHILDVTISTYGKLYSTAEELSEVRTYGKQCIFGLFKQISLLEDQEPFKRLDHQYLHLTESNPEFSEFQKFINPLFLISEKRSIVLENLKIRPSHLATLRNLISNERSFDAIKEKLVSDQLLSMPYYEQMVLLQKMSSYDYSALFLINNLSKVMSDLLDDKAGRITEPETVELRRQVLVNLLRLGDEALNVWNEPLKNSYRSFTLGIKAGAGAAQVADVYL